MWLCSAQKKSVMLEGMLRYLFLLKIWLARNPVTQNNPKRKNCLGNIYWKKLMMVIIKLYKFMGNGKVNLE